ncbi:secretin N-terminal domain-containing protein [Rubinisphaera margarita]|uniref:secretin N-terminal domain-containing protein n=1 Tax=Rubinisphaera margarita TaxID=2909586 RepID=UPI001EE9AA7D|nr:secretin N-terminal domain-containing protein [Rubinisphaera margarita]MCG6154828.1 hypothetical protein [Rubinisphaera margarita]
MRHLLVLALAMPLAFTPSFVLFAADKAKETENVQPEVHLRFVARTWDDVLAEVAAETGQTLVMPKVPRGRLTRYDRETHAPDEAIRILNHELENTGFRIMSRQNYLIVLEDDRFRPHYPATVLEESETKSERTIPEKTLDAVRRRVETAQSEIQQAAYAEEPPAPARQEALAIEPKFLNATALAKKVYEIYGEHAELIDKGPLNLPAFRVNVPVADGAPPLSFVVGIDQQNNQLILVADEQHRAQLTKVFEVLDQAAENRINGQTKDDAGIVFAPPEIHGATTKQLPQVLAQMQSDNAEAGSPAAPPQSAQPLPPEQQRQPVGPQDDLTSVLDRIRGDVSIEAITDLGLLIIRGNQNDIDGVMQIVEAIETMSAGTTPELHLRYLEHVNSESLAALLNSVYESVQTIDQRASRQNRRVNVTALVQPNAVLVVAPTSDLEAVKQLIDELDQPVDVSQQVYVFHLKNATAADAATTIETFYAERGGLGTTLRITADTRTNTLIIQASPRDIVEIRKVIHDLDKDVSHAISRLQLFPLKNAVAEELAAFINTAISEALNPTLGTQQNFQQGAQSQPKSFVLEFLAGSGTQTELIRSGILSDIRISPDPRSNSLIVIAPERSLPLVDALINALDQPSEAVAEVKVFTLTHADAAASLELLQELFNEATAESPIGSNLAGTADTGSSLLPLRFSVDVRSNSILAIGGSDALTIVEAILLRLDNAAPKKRINQVIELRNVPVTEAAEAINLFLESQRELASIDPALISSVELQEREVIVVPEPLSNNLLISATPEYFGEIINLIEQLDCEPAQVIIQAMLVEVELDNLDEFGVELGFQDSILFDRSIIENILTVDETTTSPNGVQTTTQRIVSQEGSPGFLFNNPSLYPNLGNNVGPASGPSNVGGQGLSNFGVGRVNGDLGFGGLVLSASSESVSVLIRALSQQRNVNILSRPQIRTVDQQLAQIQVGQEVPIVNGVTITTTGLANPNVEYDEAGIILSVTPRVKPDGQIVMEVIAERSAYQSGGVPIFTDAATGNTITSPIKNISVARATVGVGDGQTIVLGGMITKTEDIIIRKVPWLGDLPIIGRAFRFDSESNIRTELLIFLTPRIIHNDQTNEMIKEVEAGRIHFFREEFEDLHGPIFGVPVTSNPMIDPAHPPMTHTLPPGEQPELTPMPRPMEQDDHRKPPGSEYDFNDESQIPTTRVDPEKLQPTNGQAQQVKRKSGIPWKK